MKRIVVLPTIVSLAVLGACSSGDESGNLGTGLRAAAAAAANSDVASVQYVIESCDPLDPLRVQVVEELELERLPGNFASFTNNPLDAGSKHRFSDHFEVLEPGCYDVTVSPLRSDGTHSSLCADAWQKGVVVNEGVTSEIFMISQCKGSDPGAIDAIAAINHEPTLLDVDFEPSKFICDESAVVCAKASDVDHDPLQFEFVAPAGCQFGAQYAGEAGATCSKIECETSGRYEFAVKVYDLAWDDAVQVRIEDWLRIAGYPNESHAQLRAPIYFEEIGTCTCEGESVDVVLLQDRSGSFYNDIEEVVDQLPGIEAAIAGVATAARFGAGSFVDKPVVPFGAPADFVHRMDVPLAASIVASYPTDIFSGGDYAESQLESLMLVAKNASAYGFSSVFKYVVVMSDAPYHVAGDCSTYAAPCAIANNGDALADLGEDYPSEAQVGEALATAGIIPVFAVTADTVPTYEALVESLGVGKVITLATDSSNLADLLLESVNCID